jgi:hypothetical protein
MINSDYSQRLRWFIAIRLQIRHKLIAGRCPATLLGLKNRMRRKAPHPVFY